MLFYDFFNSSVEMLYILASYLTGQFNVTVTIDALFYVGTQLVCLSYTGKIGVWNVLTQSWRVFCFFNNQFHFDPFQSL